MIFPVPLDTLQRARAGDAGAFEQLVRKHERKVLQVALRVSGNLADAQDVAQDVLLKLYCELARFRDADEVGAWLYRVTVNSCFDHARKAKRYPAQPIGFDLQSAERSPEEEARRRQQEQQLQAALQTLSERERAAIVLRELEGLSTAEVAEALGSAESTVRVQIAAARVKLRRFFEGSTQR